MSDDVRVRTKWLLLAGVFWCASSVLEFNTEVEIYSTGGRVEFSAAGTTLTVPIEIASVEAVSLHLADGVEPPGGRFIEIEIAPGTTIKERLPRRFIFPKGTQAPLGDWELDDRAGGTVVYQREVAARGEITVRALLTGRLLCPATITLHGRPTISFQVRRGMINNDLFVRDADGEVIAVTTIDPRPLHDFGSAMTTVFRAATAACLMIFLCGLGRGWRKTPKSGVLRQASSVPRISRTWIVAIVAGLALMTVMRSMWIASDVLGQLPHQPDSVVYNLQARWMLAGDVSAPIPQTGDSGRMPYTYFSGGRWVSHYPAGWPLVLAAGLAFGKAWIVAPILGGIYIVLLFALGRQLYGNRIALLTIVLASLSPMLGLMFGCQLSHALSSTLIVAFLLTFTLARKTHNLWYWAIAGVVMGCVFGIRPLTAVALAIPCGWLMVWAVMRKETRRRELAALILVMIGGIAATIPTLVNNFLITGDVLGFPYSLAKGTMYGIENLAFGIRNMDTMLASTVPAVFGWGWGFSSGWLFLALPLAFAIVPLLKTRNRGADLILVFLFFAVVVAHIPTRAHGLHGFGPRYYFDVFFCLYLLTARGFVELTRRDRRSEQDGMAGLVLPGVLFIVLNLSTFVTLAERFELYRGYNHVNGCLWEQVDAAATALNLVFFVDDDWRNWAEATPVLNRGSDRTIFATMPQDSSPQDSLPQDSLPQDSLPQDSLPQDPVALADMFPGYAVWLWDGEMLQPMTMLGW